MFIVILIGWGWMAPYDTLPTEHIFYHGVQPQTSMLGTLCVKYDSYWYLNIVQEGYQVTSKDEQSNLRFFPAYPALMKCVSLLGIDSALAGVIISTLCLIITVLFAYRYVQLSHGTTGANATLWFFFLFPSSWVLQMVYSESLFCAALFGFFVFYRQRCFGRAALMAGVLTMTRGIGLTIFPALAIDLAVRWAKHKRWPTGPSLAFVGACCGLAIVSFTFWRAGESPIGYFFLGKPWAADWGMEDSWFRMIKSLWTYSGRPVVLLHAALLVLYAVLAIVVLIKQRDVSVYFCLVYLVALTFFSIHDSQLRYLLPLLPLHAFLSSFVKRHGWLTPLLVAMAILQLLVTRSYLDWHLTI